MEFIHLLQPKLRESVLALLREMAQIIKFYFSFEQYCTGTVYCSSLIKTMFFVKEEGKPLISILC